MGTKVREQNIWNYMYQGGKCFSPQQSSLFIMGDAKVGKSTFFNWMRGIRLKGVRQNYDIIYETKSSEAAKAELAFTSTTIIPNVDKIDVDGTEITMFDFASLDCEGIGFAEAFTVSFMIKQSAKFIDNAKFILVCDSSALISVKVKNRIQPFLNFLALFKKDFLNDDEAVSSFITSVTLVVTRTDRKYQEYLERLEDIAKFLSNNIKKQNPKIIFIVKMIQSIVHNKRIYLFPYAQEGYFALECNFMEEMNLEQKNWQYYGWKKNNKYLQLPFKSQIRELGKQQQQSFYQEILFKKTIFEDSFKILKKFLLKTIEKFKDNKISYDSEFSQIQKFIEKYNTYGKFQFEKIKRTKGIEPEKNVSKFQNYQRLIQAQKIIWQILEIEEAYYVNSEGLDYLDSIHQCQQKCQKLFTYFRDILCSCESEQTLFLNFAFLFLQAIIEFGNIYFIDGSMDVDVVPTIKDQLDSLISGNTFSETKYQFLINCKAQNIKESQKVINEIFQLEKNFTIKYVLKKSSILMRKVVQLYINQAQSLKHKGQFQEGIEILLKAWSQVQKQPSEQEENKSIFNERLTYFTYSIFSNIGECLLGLNFINLALKVFQKLKFVDGMETCYRTNFEKERDLEVKYVKMLQYGKFCQKYRRTQEAVKVYQKIHDQLSFYFPAKTVKKKEIRTLIYECLKSRKKQKYDYYQNGLFYEAKLDLKQELIMEIQKKVDSKKQFQKQQIKTIKKKAIFDV